MKLAMVVTRPDAVPPNAGPWESELYFAAPDGTAVVEYKGEVLREPPRDRQWQWLNLRHDGSGRFVI